MPTPLLRGWSIDRARRRRTHWSRNQTIRPRLTSADEENAGDSSWHRRCPLSVTFERSVTKQEMDGQVTESTQVWTVEGSTLTVETTNARGTQKRVYKKPL